MQTSVYIATSLDGFIARPDGAIDWLPGHEQSDAHPVESSVENKEPEEDYGWTEFWGSVDGMVLGRKSFEKVMEFGFWPYEDMRVIVLSTSMTAVPAQYAGKIEIYGGDVAHLLEKVAGEGHQHLYIDGGQTIQSFLRRGLITDMTITTIPVLIGEGIPLFGPLAKDIPLRHIKTAAFANGMVQSTYAV